MKIRWNNARKIVVAVTLLVIALTFMFAPSFHIDRDTFNRPVDAWDKFVLGHRWDVVRNRAVAEALVGATAFYIAGLWKKE